MADGTVKIAVEVDDKQVKGTSDRIKKEFAKVGGSLSTVGDSLTSFGKTMFAGITVPVAGAVTASIKSFADLEQAVGGIETMFKGSADAVIRNSETAYKRAGVSGVSYMEQVTSFSATLLQGLGGDTEQAAKVADTAMVDMADNANKFGTNIEAIQDAYQGFAKDNFTMLDNLKLGYGGTAGEMARLINESGVLGDTMEATAENVKDIPFHVMIEAIHEVQTELDVTGTTVLEAEETVSGSFGMMVASAQDLLAGFGDVNSDIDTLMNNLSESVQTFADNIKRVLGNIWDNLPLTDFQKWAGLIVVAGGPILMVLGTLISTLGTVVTAFAGAGTFMAGLANLAPGLAAGLSLIGQGFSALMGPIGIIIALIVALVAGFVYLWNTNEEFRTAVIDIWNNIKETIITAWQAVMEYLQPAIQAIVDFFRETFGALVIWWQENNQVILEAATNVWNFISGVIEGAMAIIWSIMQTIWPAIVAVVMFAWDGIKNVIEGTIAVITGIIDFFAALFTGNWTALWESVKKIVSGAVQAVWGFIQLWIVGKIVAAVVTFAGKIRTVFSTVWNFIKNIFSSSLSWISGKVTSIFSSISGFIGNIMSSIRGVISNVLNGIRSAFSNILGRLASIARNAFTSVTGAIRGGMNAAWNTVKGFASKFFNAGRNIVTSIADGIKGAIGKVTGAISSVTSKIRDFLPFSPAKEGPLMDLDRLNFGGPITDSILSDELEVTRAMEHLLTLPDPQHLMPNVGTAGTGGNTTNNYYGENDALIDALSNMTVVLEDGTLVGKIAPEMTRQVDRRLGRTTQRKERGLAGD